MHTLLRVRALALVKICSRPHSGRGISGPLGPRPEVKSIYRGDYTRPRFFFYLWGNQNGFMGLGL